MDLRVLLSPLHFLICQVKKSILTFGSDNNYKDTLHIVPYPCLCPFTNSFGHNLGNPHLFYNGRRMAAHHLLLLHPSPPKFPFQNPNPKIHLNLKLHCCFSTPSRREAISIASITLALTLASSPSNALAATADPSSPPPPKQTLGGICSTKSWFQFFGDGFSIRVPPQFEDIMEPEDYNQGLTLYGDKVKPKTFAARFASSDGLEVLSVVIRPTNQLKITFLEAKDVTDLGSLKEAAKIFIPGGANLFSARSIKIKEEDDTLRTYYFYEFGNGVQRVALVVAVNSGKAIIAGATAPEFKWEDDGIKLRSAAISLAV